MTTPAETLQSITSPASESSAQSANLVEARALSFSWGDRVIYDNLDLVIRRGQVTGIMGPSGTGKTTLLKLIGGQLSPDSGEILLNGRNIPDMSRTELFDARASMGMLFQSGALFTDMTVFENVAFPLRAHTDLSENLIRELVGLKLEAVGLRGTEDLMPAELSGGMNRRVALARAIALDPELIMYDEPFAGQDPIVMGVLVRLIRSLRDALGLTTVIVSHDVTETLSISDYVYVVADGKVMGEGTPEQLRNSTSPFVQQFLKGEADGPVTFQYSQDPYLASASADADVKKATPHKSKINPVQRLGRDALDRVEGIGAAGIMLEHSAIGIPALSGFALFSQQMYRVGVLSLLIILVSGLFIGLVLGLQGFTILSKYGSAQALGTMVSLTLVRELGPVITALLFAGRAGSALTAEIGLMKATEQLASMEMIGVDPLRRIVAPRFWAGVISLPMLAIIFSAIGIIGGKMVGVDWLGVDEGSFWNSMQSNVNFTNDILNGVIKSIVFGVVCTWIAVYQGYAATPTSEGISTATTNTVVYSSLCVLGLDFILTAVMFGGLS